MLIRQPHLGTMLYGSHTRRYSALPPSGRPDMWGRLVLDWRHYARHSQTRWGSRVYRQADIDRHNAGGYNFASRLASYTAQLEYEGRTLFAIQVGTYTEGTYSWRGASPEGVAFSIRTLDDYTAAYEYFFPEDDYDYDPDWVYGMYFVVAPTSIIA